MLQGGQPPAKNREESVPALPLAREGYGSRREGFETGARLGPKVRCSEQYAPWQDNGDSWVR